MLEKKVTKSEKIRQLYDAGLSVAEVSKAMGVRYQFAYNVISWHLKTKHLQQNYMQGGADHVNRMVVDNSLSV